MSCSYLSHLILFPPRSNITLRACRLLDPWEKAAALCPWVKCSQEKAAMTVNPSVAWAPPVSSSKEWVPMGCFQGIETLDCNNRVPEYSLCPVQTCPFFSQPSIRQGKCWPNMNFCVGSACLNNTTTIKEKHFQRWIKELIWDKRCILIDKAIKRHVKN